MPNNDELKRLITREFHVKPYFGHLAYKKTLMAVKKLYYWPKLKREVIDFVAKCIECQ